MSDETKEYIEPEVMGVIRITSLLRDLVLIKKYAMEKNDERIYLCADNIEQKLNRFRHGNFILDDSW
jgi:hypothetical protein